MVRRIGKRDGTVRVLWGGEGAAPIASSSCRGAALADGQVYWASFYEDWIYTSAGVPIEYISRVGTDGSAPTALTRSPDTPISDGMVAWGDSLYLHVGAEVLRMCR